MINRLLGVLSQGGEERLFYSDADYGDIIEFNMDTFVTIDNYSGPGSSPWSTGIGGIKNRIYYCDTNKDENHELNTSSLASITTVDSPDSYPRGIGGTTNKLFHTTAGGQGGYELNIDTLAVIATNDAPGSNRSGAGGLEDTLYICDLGEYAYQVSTSNFATINSSSVSSVTGGGDPKGIGGSNERLYMNTASDLFEINPTTLGLIDSGTANARALEE